MVMHAASLEVLEKANVPAPMARAFVQAIEIEIAGAKDTLATKQDFTDLRHEFAGLRHDFAELRHDFTELRSTTKQGLSEVRHGLEIKIEGVKTDLYKAINDQSNRMYAAIVGQMAVFLGLAYFFVTHLTK